MYKLVISDDEGKITVVPLVRDEISIGRAEGNTIRLTDRNVSRHHAVLRQEGGAFIVEDLDSYNGTIVGGHRIEKQARIKAGDELRIGDYAIALHVDSAEITEDSVARPLPEDRPPPARLVMLTPPVPGAEFALSGADMRLGRSEDLDIWINHRSISREHAEIVREEDGAFRILDLGSANGVRVNGEEVEEAVLEPYDVVKLGRVRLRYVPEGEGYAFDPDVEVPEDDDEDADADSSSRAPLFMALGLVVVALLVGGIIIASAGMPSAEADKQGSQGSTIGPVGETKAPPADGDGTEAQPTAEESIAACDEALKDGHFEGAIEHAEAALRLEPDNAEAAACRAKGKAGVAFQTGYKALEAGDVDVAYASFAEIPADNPFRQHPSIAEAAEKYAAAHLEQARAADAPEDALAEVQKVIDMPDAPAAEKKKALELRRELKARAAKAGRGARAAGGKAAAADALDKALACAQKGDNACVVQALEGRAATPQALALLIETYRTMGNTDAAARSMQAFVRRFPRDRRASRYQQFLDNHP